MQVLYLHSYKAKQVTKKTIKRNDNAKTTVKSKKTAKSMTLVQANVKKETRQSPTQRQGQRAKQKKIKDELQKRRQDKK